MTTPPALKPSTFEVRDTEFGWKAIDQTTVDGLGVPRTSIWAVLQPSDFDGLADAIAAARTLSPHLRVWTRDADNQRVSRCCLTHEQAVDALTSDPRVSITYCNCDPDQRSELTR
jgi:hypothetical protein